MQVKTFSLRDEAEANKFINDHVLLEEGSVQVTSDNTIVIFYKAHKDEYQDVFVSEMLQGLKRNKFHEEVRLAAMEAEVSVYKDKGGKSGDFDKVLEKQKDAQQHIRLFEAKIKTLEEWNNVQTT